MVFATKLVKRTACAMRAPAAWPGQRARHRLRLWLLSSPSPWQQAPQSAHASQHFRKVKCRFRDRRITFARPSTDFVAGAVLSQGQGKISLQAQLSRKVKYRFNGRRSTFARSSADSVAGTALSQGQVKISWQAQLFARQFHKVKYRFRVRRSTFARSSTDLVAGAVQISRKA